MGLSFEWDRRNAQTNITKHRVSFDEASTAFADPASITIFDSDHSEDEDRYVLLGHSSKRRLLVVAFTERGERIRIISARVATRAERIQYEEGQ